MQHRKKRVPQVDTLPEAALAAQCQTYAVPPEPLCSWSIGEDENTVFVAQPWNEGCRGPYPLPATAWLERTQTVLKGVWAGEEASARSTTWEIPALYRGKRLCIVREVNTGTGAKTICWTFTPGDTQNCAWPWATWSNGTRFGQQDGPGNFWRLLPNDMILWSCLATSVSVVPKTGVSLPHPLLSNKWYRHGRHMIYITIYILKFITIYIHFFLLLFFFLHSWKTDICFSVHTGHFLCSSDFALLSDLAVNSTQNRMTWENQENLRIQNKDYLEWKKGMISHF